MLNNAFEALLRQAAAAQQQRDEETLKLKENNRKIEEGKRKVLIEQFKRKPAYRSSAVAPPSIKPSITVNPTTKPTESTTLQPNKPLSYEEIMKMAENNVKEGKTLLDRPKPVPVAVSTTKLSTSSTRTCTSTRPPIKTLTAPRSSMDTGVQKITQRLQANSGKRTESRKRRPTSSAPSVVKKLRCYSDEENDSDLDGFVDDDDITAEVEIEIKSVVQSLCRSDKNTWKQREKVINLRNMDNTYRGVEMEEKRSARLARQEDKQEEARGAKRV